MTKTKFEAMDILNKFDIPCGPILSMKEIAEEPSLRATGTVVEVDHPTRGKYLTVGNPIKMSDSPPKSRARRCSASTPRKCWTNSATAASRSRALRDGEGHLNDRQTYSHVAQAISTRNDHEQSDKNKVRQLLDARQGGRAAIR